MTVKERTQKTPGGYVAFAHPGDIANQRQSSLAKICNFTKLKSKEAETKKSETFRGTARETVRGLLSFLSPVENEKDLSSTKEIQVFNKAIASIIEAADEKIITQEEADAVINFMAVRYVSRRFDSSLRRVVMPRMSGWFLFTHHHKTGTF